jgi:uncharacterized protein with GYD domain
LESGDIVPLFVILGKFTQKRMETIRDLPTNIEEAQDAFGGFGIEFVQLIFTMGQYDVVAVAEAPDEETMSKATLSWGSRGFLKTETLRGFTPEEMIGMVKEI